MAEILNTIDGFLGASVWFPYVLLGTGLFFTFYLKFPQFRYFGHALKVIRGTYEKEEHEGDTTHFQALTTALSGTVGTGNIGGVAFALFLGGPAALFWMWATAFFGMTTKFVEVTLSHKYREKAEDGTISGGPMYYMKNRLKLPWLGAFFAVATVVSSFGTGNMPQINNIAQATESTFGIDPLVTGIVLAVILALVIIGGIKRIAQVTSKIVPAMATLYILGALAVIITNIGNVGPAFWSIFESLFAGTAMAGGFLGAIFADTFNRGVGRGLFSNEAGQGSAPIAHAAAKADEPVSEGMVAILEPFIDTLIICTITGLVILSSGAWTDKYENTFNDSELFAYSGVYLESNDDQRQQIANAVNGLSSSAALFSGTITVDNGRAVNADEFTLIHARSFADDVRYQIEETPYSGPLSVNSGKVQRLLPDGRTVDIVGKSLIHSAALTTEAFKISFLGEYGAYIVTIGLLLFAFSTVISWSYYGDRAMTYLFGSKSVIWYRVVYVIGFIYASFQDTSLIWIFANIAIAVMTLPNLVGILILHKEMKYTVKDYVKLFNDRFPNEKPLT